MSNEMHPLAIELGIDPEKFDRQCLLEMEGFVLGGEKYLRNLKAVRKSEDKDSTNLLAPEHHLMGEYIPKLTLKLRNELSFLKRREHGYPLVARKFLKDKVDFPHDRLAYLILRYAFNIPADGNTVQRVCIRLGHQIEKDYEYLQFEAKAAGYLSAVENNLRTSTKHVGHRHKVLNHCLNKVKILDDEGNVIGHGIPKLNWDDKMRFAVGKLLLECLTEATPLFEVITYQTRHRIVRKVGNKWKHMRLNQLVLRRTAECQRWLEDNHMTAYITEPLFYPFIVHPKPWTSVEGGGFWTAYKTLVTDLVKTKLPHAKLRVKRHGVETVNEALNVIQGTKFRIHKRILEVMKVCAEHGEAGLPARDPEDVKTSSGRKVLAEETPFDNVEFERKRKAKDPDLLAWLAERSEAFDLWERNRSKREALLWKLRIAEQFKDEPEIYFVWNLDFRGRIYCLQPFINPQMDDSGKALLEFAESKPLGEHGFRHLCIHGSNVFGYDKVTLDERVQWVKDHHHEIVNSAENPLDGMKFWMDADKPFNFLAFCFEYAEAHKNPMGFESRLPVQQDGTCSGLQHYSALLRDEHGGKIVNLTPSDEKADVYNEVAKVATELLKLDIMKGGEEAEYASLWLSLPVDRSIVKRNAMTWGYGATRAGFTDQLVHLVRKESLPIPREKLMPACNYLGGINWNAISQVVIKAAEGMNFLQKVAYFMSSRQYDICWSNEVGLRVTQDYRKTKTKRLNTWWGDTRIQPSMAELTKEKNAAGARNGIAPNFIHSMDASHLMLTAIKCAQQGINAFSFIHDSFGTHAADMEAMAKILRETFVEMYSENLLDKLIKDLTDQIKPEHREEFDKLVTELKPEMGSLDVTCVQRSPYFFS